MSPRAYTDELTMTVQDDPRQRQRTLDALAYYGVQSSPETRREQIRRVRQSEGHFGTAWVDVYADGVPYEVGRRYLMDRGSVLLDGS